VTEELLTLDDAAARTPWSTSTLRRAIKTTDPHSFPPPLRAKRGPRGQHVILASELTRWMREMPDA
jgi:hypothetical protein